MGTWNIQSSRFESFFSGSSGVTRYEPIIGTIDEFEVETEVESTLRTAYTLSKLYVNININTTTAAHTLRSRNNQANGNQSLSIPAATSGEFEDTVNSDSLVDGDEANTQIVFGTIMMDETIEFRTIGYVLDDAAGNEFPLIVSRNSVPFQDSITAEYLTISGSLSANETTESITEYVLRQSATFSNLRVLVTDNSIDNASTLTFRDNGANGNLTVSIPGDTTGLFEDTTNTDSLTSGDTTNYVVTTGASAMASEMRISSVNISVDGTNFVSLTSRRTVNTLGDGFAVYFPTAGDLDSKSDESKPQMKAREEVKAQNLFFRASANTLDDATTFALRINSVNSSLSVSIAASTSGVFEDTINTPTIDDQDDINYILDSTASTSGQITFNIGAFEQQEPAGPVTGDNVGPGPVGSTSWSIGRRFRALAY